jgi:hypothetical protein
MALAPIAGANGGELLFAPSDHAINSELRVANATSAQKTRLIRIAPSSTTYRRRRYIPVLDSRVRRSALRAFESTLAAIPIPSASAERTAVSTAER